MGDEWEEHRIREIFRFSNYVMRNKKSVEISYHHS